MTLEGALTLVTGASSGVGQAIARAFAAAGARVLAVGRDSDALAALARLAGRIQICAADLSRDEDIQRLAATMRASDARLRVLVHAAALYERGSIAAAPVESFDTQYRVNLRAPYLLTQALLPELIAAGGDVVFVNSTVGLRAGAEIGQYGATKAGLRALADSLREEVNSRGVRVTSVFLDARPRRCRNGCTRRWRSPMRRRP